MYEAKQSKTQKREKNLAKKKVDKDMEERLRLLHSRNKAYIQQLEEKSRQMRELEKQEVERVNAFRERLRKRILKEVSQTNKDFAMKKAEQLLKQQAEVKQQQPTIIHRTQSVSPVINSRHKFAFRNLHNTRESKLRRPTTSTGARDRKPTGFERLQQLPRPKTSHCTKALPEEDKTEWNRPAQGSGRQGVARLRENRIITGANTSTSASTSPTFATTMKIYRSIQCNPNPSLKRYLTWKKRNDIAFEAKVFTISGEKNFSYIRRALLERDWIENRDSNTNSEFFDLKWSLHSADIKHINLRHDQIVNHFEHAASITTKCGLLKTFKELALFASVDAPRFYPRSYELSTEDGKWEFDKEFEMSAALAALKRAWVDLHSGAKSHLDENAQLALEAWRSRLRHDKNFVEEDFEGDTPWLPKLKNAHWKGIRSSDIFQKPPFPLDVLRAMDRKVSSSISKRKEEQASLAGESASSAEEADESSDTEMEDMGEETETDIARQQMRHKKVADSCGDMMVTGDSLMSDSNASTQDHFGEEDLNGDEQTSESSFEMLEILLVEIAQRYSQFHIDGMHNIWIVKPGGKSRGRGIRCFNNLHDIWTYVRQDITEKWVVQKYIERPLLVYGRKFDIRQWVMVTDWNPLTVWMYNECYLRFAVEDFDLLNLNSYVHLCNNSIVKNSERFETAADEIESDGNMWSMSRFQTYLAEEQQAGDVLDARILPQIKKIITDSLRSAQSAVKGRKETCQVFGYDFLVDDNFNVWLLEINSSPTMEPSTSLTARLCKEFQEDTVKIIVDLPNEQIRRQRNGESRIKYDNPPEDLDLGNFKCIVSDMVQAKQPKYVGLKLFVEGKGISTRRCGYRIKRRKSMLSEITINSSIKDKDKDKDKGKESPYMKEKDKNNEQVKV